MLTKLIKSFLTTPINPLQVGLENLSKFCQVNHINAMTNSDHIEVFSENSVATLTVSEGLSTLKEGFAIRVDDQGNLLGYYPKGNEFGFRAQITLQPMELLTSDLGLYFMVREGRIEAA